MSEKQNENLTMEELGEVSGGNMAVHLEWNDAGSLTSAKGMATTPEEGAAVTEIINKFAPNQTVTPTTTTT